MTKYAIVRCRVSGTYQPSVWKNWENEVKMFLRERAGPGKVPKDQRQPGEPLFNWTVTYNKRRKDADWRCYYYNVWFKDPAIASLFTLAFSEYLDG